jgi:hypothetical protein
VLITGVSEVEVELLVVVGAADVGMFFGGISVGGGGEVLWEHWPSGGRRSSKSLTEGGLVRAVHPCN